jgi:cytochrome c oxidase subunit IV
MKTIALMLVLTITAFADTVAAPSGTIVEFLLSVWQTIQSLGGLTWSLKITAIITLVIASMKVSFLNELIWSKLGNLKTWVGPILGLLVGLVSLVAQGNLSLVGVFAYFSAGIGAIALHELLDTIKGIPGLGPIYVGIIDAIEKTLGGPKSTQVTA